MKKPELKGRTALVTGAGGYLGSWMVDKLHGSGATCVAMAGPTRPWRDEGQKRYEVTALQVDLATASVDTLLRECGQVDHIFHMAAVGVSQATADFEQVTRVNLGGLMTVLAYAREVKAKSVVVTGSGFEYPAGRRIEETTSPDPQAFYAVTKAAGSMMAIAFAQMFGLPVSVLRPFVVYGPGEAAHRLVTQVCRAVLSRQPVDITSGAQLRDWIFVEDAIEAHLRAAVVPASAGQVFNVASGQAVSVRRVAELIADLAGADRSLLRFGARADRAQEICEQSGCPKKALEILGWTATTGLEAGLRKTLDWYRQHA